MIAFPLAPDRAARLLLRACVRAGRMRALYDPAQERDERGRWTSGSGFDADISDRYPIINEMRAYDERDAKSVRSQLRQKGRLNADGTTSLYHVTLSDPESITERGLIPAFETAPGQNWQAQHSSYATYFFLDKEHAIDQVEQTGVGAVVEARIPITGNTLSRFVPDEDSSIDIHDGVKVLVQGGAVAFIGGVPASAVRITHRRGLEFNPDQPRDDEGQWTDTGAEGKAWKNKSPKTAAEISGVTPPVPLKTIKAYHVTNKANAEKILKDGFDITKVKPRWKNDYAISLSKGEKNATDYFSKRDPKTGKAVGMDTSKYTLLEVTIKGRLSGERAVEEFTLSAQDYTRKLIGKGLDGQDLGLIIYVNNPKSITSIREIKPKKLRGAEFDPSQPRDEQGQWTDAGSAYAKDVGARLNVITDGKVDGRIIPDFDDEHGPDVPNVSSISASLTDYDVLDGIREVPLSEFTGNEKPSFYSVTEERRVNALAERIRESGTITPLIVVYDGVPRGPYVLEGGHRFDALLLLGAKSMPAMVVIDNEKFRAGEFNPEQERDEHGRWTDGGEISVVHPELWKTFSSTDDPDDFYYHVTLAPRAKVITKTQAIKPGVSSLMGVGGYTKHSEEKVFLTERAGVSFWTERVELHAFDQFDNPPDVAVVMIPKSAVPDVILDPLGTRDAHAPAYYVKGKIDLKKMRGAASGMRMLFDPNQARDESGKWTAGAGSDQSWTKEDREQASLNGIPFQEDPAPDFSRSVDKTIAEPPFPDLPKGKHAAAGVVVTEPDGRVWMVQPYGKYGGYKNTFPKGTIDPGEDLQETAAREVWEETGLVVKITGHLADVERSTSVTRFYEGRRIGGAPWAHAKETYAVRLMPIEGKKIEGALKSVRGAHTADHKVLDALRRSRASRLLAEFDEAKHPRDERGRWVGSGASGLQEIAKNQKFYSIDKPNRIFRHLTPEDREVYLKDFRRMPEARRDSAVLEEVDITDLASTQKSIEVAQVKELIEDPSLADDPEDGPPLVVKWHDQHVVGDGHHRIAAALLRGETKMEVEYVDLDAYLKKHPRAAEFNPSQARDEAGRWTDTDGDWPKGLTNISGAKGTNPGGLYKDTSGQKWYVKRYNDPRQAATEHIANEVYRSVGVGAPHSVLGEGGDYASKWMPADGTLAQEGITKERADRILDGFAADVFLDNWDAVGTGHDNILVKGDKVTRVDQGGTLIFRAQGALKPESGLEKIDEWESLVEKNVYYSRIFKAAGVKDGDALGERAAKQIDRIVKARPAKGWKELVDRVAPKADAGFRAKVAKMLEARQKGLERKRDELRRRAAEFNPDQPRDESGKWTEGGGVSSDTEQRAITEISLLKGALTEDGKYNDDVAMNLLLPDYAHYDEEEDPDELTDQIFESVGGIYSPEAIEASTEATKESKGIVESVPISNIDSTQSTLSRKALEKYVKTTGWEKEAGIGIRDGGRVLLIDGNHRVVALKLRGDGKANIRIVSVKEQHEKAGFSKRNLTARAEDLKIAVARLRALHLPGEHEQQSHAGGTGGIGEKKKKAPKAPPVPLESKKAAYDEVKKGATFKKTAEKYGMTQGQLSGYVWKIDQAKKKVEEGLQEQQAAETVVKAPEKPTEKPWAEMSGEERLTYAHEQGYAWKPKPESKSGNYAWYDKEGHQVSGFGPKESYREKLETINYGAGIVPKVPDVPAPAGVWPISNDVERQMSDGYANKVAKAHTPWSKTLTHDERVAIEGYTGSNYAGLNEALREGGGLSSFHAGTASKLNSAIDKAPKPPPPELIWRGISSDNAAKIFGGLKNGDTLVMKGFQSSTIRPAFANSWGGGKIIFEIKPSKGAYVKLLSGHPHEYEYLLPHNAKYTVRGVTHVKFQGVGSPVRVLQLEMH